jgi:hypothetical protein
MGEKILHQLAEHCFHGWPVCLHQELAAMPAL